MNCIKYVLDKTTTSMNDDKREILRLHMQLRFQGFKNIRILISNGKYIASATRPGVSSNENLTFKN